MLCLNQGEFLHSFYIALFVLLTAGFKSVCRFMCAIKVIVDQLEHCTGHLFLFLDGSQIN